MTRRKAYKVGKIRSAPFARPKYEYMGSLLEAGTEGVREYKVQ
jgi:hypothetical protein